jgi:hypothetical protein
MEWKMKQSELLTATDIAEMLQVSKRTVLERYAVRPDFPNRISISKHRFWWKREEVMIWLERNKEKRATV